MARIVINRVLEDGQKEIQELLGVCETAGVQLVDQGRQVHGLGNNVQILPENVVDI